MNTTPTTTNSFTLTKTLLRRQDFHGSVSFFLLKSVAIGYSSGALYFDDIRGPGRIRAGANAAAAAGRDRDSEKGWKV